MGLFCASIHLKCEDRQAAEAVLEGEGPSVVLDPAGGWLSVYADGLKESGPDRLAAFLSSELAADSIAFSIHDSDIVQYWLHRSGRLVDSYNSWPGYFDGAEARPIGGDLEALARLAAGGRGVRELRRVMAADHVFADDVVEQVASILGIAEGRAITDYRDLENDGGEADSITAALAGATAQLRPDPTTDYDDGALALVRAAAWGDIGALQTLAASGASLDEAAPGPMPGDGQVASGVAAIRPEMTPLIAAIVNRQLTAAAALLDLGADPNVTHHLHGSGVHVASGMGYPDALELVLDRGGDPTAPGLQSQTPLQALAAGRQAFAMMGEARQLMESMGLDTSMLEQFGGHQPSAADWEQCEELLRSRRAGH